MTPIILASTSPFRRKLLEDFGLVFDVVAPETDEDIFKSTIKDPELLTEKLAFEKAQAVAKNHPDSIVIGCDQVVDFKGKVLSKPGSIEKARWQLKELQGQTHRLVTAMSVQAPHQLFSHIDITTMHMRKLSDEQIRSYVEFDQAWESAGSYKFEKAGRALFEKIESDDESAIIGLPLIALANILLQLNFKLPCFGGKHG